MAHNFPGLFSTGYTRAHSSPSLTRAGQIPVHNLLIKNCLSLLKTPLKIEFTRHNLPLLFSAGTFNARYFQCAHNSDTAFSKVARLVKFFFKVPPYCLQLARSLRLMWYYLYLQPSIYVALEGLVKWRFLHGAGRHTSFFSLQSAASVKVPPCAVCRSAHAQNRCWPLCLPFIFPVGENKGAKSYAPAYIVFK